MEGQIYPSVSVSAITPEEISLGFDPDVVSPKVIAAVNKLIQEKMRASGITVILESDIARASGESVVSKRAALMRLYHTAGWIVESKSQGFVASQNPYFIFQKRPDRKFKTQIL